MRLKVAIKAYNVLVGLNMHRAVAAKEDDAMCFIGVATHVYRGARATAWEILV